jgi:hypothetical protein
VFKSAIPVAAVALAFSAGGAAQTLTNDTLKTFIEKNNRTKVVASEFESPTEVQNRLSYLQRDFDITAKPKHSEFSPAYTYDHNTQTLTFNLRTLNWVKHSLIYEYKPSSTYSRESASLLLTNYPCFVVAEKNLPPVEKTGQTAMGVKMKFTEYHSESWGVALLNFPAKNRDPLGTVKLQLSADDAKKLVTRLVWRIQGETLPVGLSGLPRGVTNRDWPLLEVSVKEATLDSPSSLYYMGLFAPAVAKSITLIDSQDGKVYGSIEVK